MRIFFYNSLHKRFLISLSRDSQSYTIPVTGKRFLLWFSILMLSVSAIFILTWRVNSYFQKKAYLYDSNKSILQLPRTEIERELMTISIVEDSLFSTYDDNEITRSLLDLTPKREGYSKDAFSYQSNASGLYFSDSTRKRKICYYPEWIR